MGALMLARIWLSQYVKAHNFWHDFWRHLGQNLGKIRGYGYLGVEGQSYDTSIK